MFDSIGIYPVIRGTVSERPQEIVYSVTAVLSYLQHNSEQEFVVYRGRGPDPPRFQKRGEPLKIRPAGIKTFVR